MRFWKGINWDENRDIISFLLQRRGKLKVDNYYNSFWEIYSGNYYVTNFEKLCRIQIMRLSQLQWETWLRCWMCDWNTSSDDTNVAKIQDACQLYGAQITQRVRLREYTF